MVTSEDLMRKPFDKTSFSKKQPQKWYGMGPCRNSTMVSSEKLTLDESEIEAVFCALCSQNGHKYL